MHASESSVGPAMWHSKTTRLHPFPDQFTPIGSDIYYALRFAPRRHRNTLSLVHAVYRSLRDIPVDCSDPTVARAKLDWWTEELNRAERGQARHPVARALTEIYPRYPTIGDNLGHILQATAREIDGFYLRDHLELETHCAQTGARFTQMLATAADGDRAQVQAAERFGRFVRSVEIVRDLGQDLRRGRCLLPAELLAEHNLARESLFDGDNQPRLRNLLVQLADGQRRLYLQTLAGLTGVHAPLGSVRSLAAMAYSLLQELEKEGFRVLQQRTSLTPLRMLKISWRSHRQARRAKVPGR